MIKIASTIDSINQAVGKAVSWLSLLLVLIIIVDVFLRYTFSVTSSASFELEWHLFAVLFLISAAWTLQQDRHVRVDVFYQQFSERNKARVNLFGSIFLLLPLCIVGVIEGSQFALNAYLMGEKSPDPGGLPARFIIKSVIPLGFLLLGLQGISAAITNFDRLKNGKRK